MADGFMSAQLGRVTQVSNFAGGHAPLSTGSLTGGVASTSSAAYNVTGTDFAIYMDATSGNKLVSLPPATTMTGKIIVVKKIDASANTVTVVPAGAETIDGAVNKVLTAQYQSIMLHSTGATWYII